MQGELMHINNTLTSLREKAEQRRQHQQVNVHSGDTVALRAAVNARWVQNQFWDQNLSTASTASP